MEYPVHLERDDNNTWLVSFPDFPEAHTFGDTEADALVQAREALATVIDGYMAVRREIPGPSPASTAGGYTVPLPALMEAKLALYDAALRLRVNKAELARRLDVHPPQVDRLFDLHHGSRMDQLEAAFQVLGKRMFVTVVDALPDAFGRQSDPTYGRRATATKARVMASPRVVRDAASGRAIPARVGARPATRPRVASKGKAR